MKNGLIVVGVVSLVFGCSGGGSESGQQDQTQNVVNSPPVAVAGADINIDLGETATLDGSSSHDPDGDTLTYQWSLDSKPDDSQWMLSGAGESTLSVIPDAPGEYQLSLKVYDGQLWSAADPVTVTALQVNSPPIANAGKSKTQWVNTTLQLDGSLSVDPENGDLTYNWQLVDKPQNSIAQLNDSTHQSPSLLLDAPGVYTLDLTVNDGTQESEVHRVAFSAVSSTQNLLLNGDFAQGLNHWVSKGSSTNTLVSLNGSQSLLISSRGDKTAGVRQDIISQIDNSIKGQGVVTKVMLELEQAAHVKVMMIISDSSGSYSLQLAEKTVRATQSPVAVEGNATIDWNGTLNACNVYVEIHQVVSGVLPDYRLESVTIEQDGDGDGLSESEEVAFNSNPFEADTDGDGLPDDWEFAYDRDPLEDDSQGDPDVDGATDLQEYWAATDPDNSDSYPGKPANSSLNNDAKALLQYLALLPSRSGNKVIAGQHVADSASTDNQGYEYNVAAIEATTGKALAMVELQYDGRASVNQYQIAETNLLAEQIYQSGALVEIKWNPWNPWSGTSYVDQSQFYRVDILGMLSQNTPENQQAFNQFNVYLDTVAAGLSELQQNNRVVLWRMMSEMNGAWFWWGRRTQEEYVALWRYVYFYFTDVKQLNHLIWVYESASAVHNLTPSDYYFPGDDVVDVVGHNLYDDDWILPYDLNKLFRQYSKVYALPQAGSAGQSPVRLQRNGWDNLIIIDGITQRFPRVSYFNVWNTFSNSQATQYVAIIDHQNAQGLVDHPWVVTREELE